MATGRLAPSAMAEADDARVDLVDIVSTDPRFVFEGTGDPFERPCPATLQVLDAAWRAEQAEQVGPRTARG